MKKEWEKLNRRVLKKLPHRDWHIEAIYKYIYLVPAGSKHESGFMHIAIVGEKHNGEMEVAAYPDDINWDYSLINQKYSCTGVRTDCSYPGGIMRFWSNNYAFRVGHSMSSTDITIVEKINEK